MSAREENSPHKQIRPAHGLQQGPAFPLLRWVALIWLLIWIPAYWQVWGWQNFFHLCDAAVFLACVGLWSGNRLLISSQTLASVLPDMAWCMDAGWRGVTGHNLFGGTEYMWDARFPVEVRLLSLFHVALPIVLIVACARIGYDRRALWFQTAITAALLGVSRWLGPELNTNYVFRDPLFHRTMGPAPLHMLAILAGMMLLYLPVHLFLSKVFSHRGVDSES